MNDIVIFGAGGRAGQAAVAEARRRGHLVTAVVRAPERSSGLLDPRVRLLAGDVTDPADVAALAAGHEAAIHAAAVYGEGTDPDAFFPAAARALIDGLHTAGVPRLVTIGLATLLPGPDGVRLVDTASFPAQYRPFSLAHASGLEILRAESGGLDWLCLSPAGDFDRDGARTGRYTIGEHVRTETRVSYADFAIALIDEADSARHHRSQLAVS